MKVCNLSSGSDGNSTYVESETTRVLVDIGLSCKEIELRLGFLKVDPSSIDAILITHEHSDHIKGLEVFAHRYGTKVFVHKDGYLPLHSKIKRPLNYVIFDDVNFEIGDLSITPIEVPHDVQRCTGYVINENNKKISIFTDLGHTTTEMLQNLYNSNLVFLEANHDPDKLRANPRYPIYLKQRILGNNGHLSNEACANAIEELAHNGCKLFVLSHLSTENNSPEFAFGYIKSILESKGIIEGKNIKIDIASTVPTTVFML